MGNDAVIITRPYGSSRQMHPVHVTGVGDEDGYAEGEIYKNLHLVLVHFSIEAAADSSGSVGGI